MSRVRATADVAVVGGGVIGASIAFHLASRGADVTLLERSAIRSGPARHSAAIVHLHSAQPLLVRMAAHGLQVYRAFGEIVGRSSGFTRTGMLVGVDERDRELLAGTVAVGQAEGVETHLVDAAQAAEIDPRVVADDLVFCFEPGAGHCDPHLVTGGFGGAAARLGARILEGVAVRAVGEGGVSTDDGDVSADAVVVAAGPWTAPLLAPLGVALDLRAARGEAARFRLPETFGTPPPAVADVSAGLVIRPAEPGFLEVGSLDPRHGDEPVDPDAVPECAEHATLEAFRDGLVRRLRGVESGHFGDAWSGVYGVTPDGEPAVGLVPGTGRLVVAAGFSGHGLTLAPAVGAVVAELVLDGVASSFDVGPFAPDRFDRGEPEAARHGDSVLG